MTGRADSAELLRRFGRGVDHFLKKSGKSGHASGLFDLRRRSLVACYCYFDHLEWALGRLTEAGVDAETVGRGSRRICGRPSGQFIHGMLWAYLLARENEFGAGRDPDDGDFVTEVLHWWVEMIEINRGDGFLLPNEADGRQTSVPDELPGSILDQARQTSVEGVGRLTAALQMYSYTLNGEQRGTTNFHGPYPSPRDPAYSIIVEEFTAIRHNQSPWSPDPAPFEFDEVAAIFEVENTEFDFDLFGGMQSKPNDYQQHLVRAAIVTTDSGEPVEIDAEGRAGLIESAAAEQKRIFREQLGWDDDLKITYGIYHYLDTLASLLEPAGLGSEMVEARQRFEETAARRLEEIRAWETAPAWSRLLGGGEIFTPIGGR